MLSLREITSDRRRATVCVEDLPSISATVLRALRERSSYRPHDPLQRIATARSSDASKFVFIATTDRHDAVRLSYTHDGQPQNQTVLIAEMVVGAAKRRLFICPLTGRKVRTLYLANGLFCSRHAYNIPYSTQVDCQLGRLLNRRDAITQAIEGDIGCRPAKGRRRRRLINQLRALRWSGVLSDEHENLINRYDWDHYPVEKFFRAIRAEANRRRRGQSASDRTIDPGHTAPSHISPRKTAAVLHDPMQQVLRVFRAEAKRRRRQRSASDRAIDPIQADPGSISPEIVSASLDEGFEALLNQLGLELSDGRTQPWLGPALPRAALEDHLVVDLRLVHRPRRPGRPSEGLYHPQGRVPPLRRERHRGLDAGCAEPDSHRGPGDGPGVQSASSVTCANLSDQQPHGVRPMETRKMGRGLKLFQAACNMGCRVEASRRTT